MTYKVGDAVLTWFSGREDGMSTILVITPYRGAYLQYFTHILRVTAPRTTRGWMEVLTGPGGFISPVEPE